MKLLNQITKGLGAIVLGLTLVACGSDGGSINTLKGTAATGAAIVGTVEVVGAGGNVATATIEADGSFKVKVNGMDAPFMLRTIASNGSASEYSYAEQANVTVNITPLTSMAMLVAAGNVDPSIMYNNWASSFGNVTADSLENAQATVNANLQMQYAANGLDPLVYDFFGTEFSANGIGFDALLDSITVSLGNGVITINGGAFNAVIDISGFNIGGVSNTDNTGGTTTEPFGTYTVTYKFVIDGMLVGGVIPAATNYPAEAVPTVVTDISTFKSSQEVLLSDMFSSLESVPGITFVSMTVTGDAAQIVLVLDFVADAEVSETNEVTDFVITVTYTQN